MGQPDHPGPAPRAEHRSRGPAPRGAHRGDPRARLGYGPRASIAQHESAPESTDERRRSPTTLSPTERVKARAPATGPPCTSVFNNPARHNALSGRHVGAPIPPLLARAGGRRRTRAAWLSSVRRGRRSPSSPAPTSRSSRTCAPRSEAVKDYEADGRSPRSWASTTSASPPSPAIRGYCIGGGRERRDQRATSASPTSRLPCSPSRPARLGLGYRLLGAQEPRRPAGAVGAAKDMFFTARRLDAAEALSHRAGFAHRRRWPLNWSRGPASPITSR